MRKNTTSQNPAKMSWTPLVVASLLGLGSGISGTLTYQHFKPQVAPQAAPQVAPDSESSTREDVPEELKRIVPTFGSPTSNEPVGNQPVGTGATANKPVANKPVANKPVANGPLANGQGAAQAALSQGNTLYDGQNWNQAALQYEAAIAGGLDNADVRTDLGNCYRFLEQPQKALEQYRLAQKQNPQHEQSLFNQGGLYAFSLKDNAKAIAKWREYLQRFPRGGTVAEARRLIAQAQSGQLPQLDANTPATP